jgi:S1-C subfamily serine protease
LFFNGILYPIYWNGEHYMLKAFKLFIITLLIGAVGCVANTESGLKMVKNPPQVVSSMLTSTVALVHTLPDGRIITYCTGVVVSPKGHNYSNIIVTAKHCMEGLAKQTERKEKELEGMDIHFTFYDEHAGLGEEPYAIHLGELVMTVKNHDLAIIKMYGKISHPAIPLAKINPALGEKVYGMGHPAGHVWTLVQGIVSAYRHDLPHSEEHGPFLQLSAPLFFGNSGGGVFNEDGELCGILIELSRVPLLNFSVALPTIHKALHTYETSVKNKVTSKTNR